MENDSSKLDKRYWLRGGLGFMVIGIFAGFFATLSFTKGGIAGGFLGGSGGSLKTFIMLLIIWVPQIAAIFFGAGVFLGWIYGKIKNRNKLSATNY